MFNCKDFRDNVKGILILSLLWSDTLMRRAIFVLQPYLTNVWQLSFTHAVAIVNIWEGTSLVLPAVFQFLADKYLGNFMVVVICAISSTLGLGLVTMSLPPVLGISTCKEYKKGCIDDGQRSLLYLGVALTAIGRGGLSVSVPRLHEEESEAGPLCWVFVREHGSKAENLFVYAVGTLIISLISSWTFRFGFPAIYAAYVTVLFLCFWSTYKKAGPKRKGSLLAALFKKARNRRVEQNPASPEESSFARHITGISITFIILGIVSALGNTFFVEQANHMSRKIGSLTLPLAAFQLPMLIGSVMGSCLSVICEFINNHCGSCCGSCILPSILGIGAAMVDAILCCVVAAAVEKQRHRGAHGAVVKMHAAWLIFQFYLIGGVNSLFRCSVETYYEAQAQARGGVRNYHDVYTDFVTGLGYFSSVILVAIVGKISERGKEGKSWFEETVDMSRLDRYYWLLAVLSCLSLVAFVAMVWKDVMKAPPPAGGGDERERQSSSCFGR